MGELLLHEKSRAELASIACMESMTGKQRVRATPNGQDVTYFVPVVRECLKACQHLNYAGSVTTDPPGSVVRPH